MLLDSTFEKEAQGLTTFIKLMGILFLVTEDHKFPTEEYSIKSRCTLLTISFPLGVSLRSHIYSVFIFCFL